VGNIAVNFFRASFRNQGQKINGSIKKWPSRGGHPDRRDGRDLLVDSGRLRRGIIVKSASSGRVVIGVDAIVSSYASLQNDGGNIQVTPKMRKFFWAMWHQSKDDFWKGMAITKKTHIQIKARPFIYDSPDLANEITKDIEKRLKKILEQ
jgi:phage gpG-like protein